MIEKWNFNGGTSDSLGTTQKDDRDIWKHIQTKFKEGYFIPTTEECIAAFSELEITSENYLSYGLTDFFTSCPREKESIYSTWIYNSKFNASYRNHTQQGSFRLFAKF